MITGGVTARRAPVAGSTGQPLWDRALAAAREHSLPSASASFLQEDAQKQSREWRDRVDVALNVTVQCAFMTLSILQCLAYWGDFRGSNRTGWVAVTAALLFPALIIELLVMVQVQGGPLQHRTSWQRFFLPGIHKLQAVLLLGCVFRLAMCIVTLVVGMGERSSALRDVDQGTVLILPVHRMVRIWSILSKQNVETFLINRRERVRRGQVWPDEFRELMKKHDANFWVKLERGLDNITTQLILLSGFIILSLLFFLERWLLLVPTWVALLVANALLGADILALLIRAMAQGIDRFFNVSLHVYEVLVLSVLGWSVGYTTWAPSFAWAQTGAVRIAIMALFFLHWIMRLLGIVFHVSGSHTGFDSILNSGAVNLIFSRFSDLLEVPPQNLRVELAGKVKLHVLKAVLKPRAFEGLHLPLSLVGGMVEELYVDVTFWKRRSHVEGPRKSGTEIRVRNLVLLVGPGPGLGEAGGIRSSYGADEESYWTFESVLKAKSTLVDLVCSRLSPNPAKSGGDAATSSRSGPGQRAGSMFQGVRARAAQALERGIAMAQEVSLREVHIKVDNIILQYEDRQDELRRGHMVMGLKVGCLHIHRIAGESARCHLQRSSIFVEPGLSAFASGSSARSAVPRAATLRLFRTEMADLMEENPSRAAESLRRLDCSERLRVAAFATLEAECPLSDAAQHERTERWPEHRHVISLTSILVEGRPQLTQLHEEGADSQHSGTFKSEKGQGGGQRSRKGFVHREDTEPWRWKIKAKPIRIAVDNEQMEYVRVLGKCLANWLIHDQAMRWRPQLTPLEGPLLSQPTERGVVVRLWWLYALQRVLARQGRRPNVWVDIAILAIHCRRYSTQLGLIAARLSQRRAGGAPSLKPSKDEKRWLEELQVLLPIEEIVKMHQKALDTLATLRTNRLERSGRQPSHWGWRRSDATAAPSSKQEAPHSTASLANLEEDVEVGRDIVDKFSSEQSVERLDSAVEDMDAAQEADNEIEMEAEEAASFPEPDAAPVGTEAPQKQAANTDELDTAQLLRSLCGSYEVNFPLIEVRIMRFTAKPRPVLLHFKLEKLVVEGRVVPVIKPRALGSLDNLGALAESGKVKPVPNPLPIEGVVTLANLALNCPDAQDLVMGGSHEMLSIDCPFVLDHPRPGQFRGTQVGKELALAIRAKFTPGQHALLEVTLADLRATIYEPVILSIMHILIGNAELEGWTADPSHNHSQARSAGHPVIKRRGGGLLKVQSAKRGIFRQVMRVHDTPLAAEMASRSTKFGSHARAVHEKREEQLRITELHRIFEVLAGLQLETSTVNLELRLGAVHAVQISKAGKTLALIEEARIKPFQASLFRGVGSMQPIKLPSWRSWTLKWLKQSSTKADKAPTRQVVLECHAQGGIKGLQLPEPEDPGLESCQIFDNLDEKPVLHSEDLRPDEPVRCVACAGRSMQVAEYACCSTDDVTVQVDASSCEAREPPLWTTQELLVRGHEQAPGAEQTLAPWQVSFRVIKMSELQTWLDREGARFRASMLEETHIMREQGPDVEHGIPKEIHHMLDQDLLFTSLRHR